MLPLDVLLKVFNLKPGEGLDLPIRVEVATVKDFTIEATAIRISRATEQPGTNEAKVAAAIAKSGAVR